MLILSILSVSRTSKLLGRLERGGGIGIEMEPVGLGDGKTTNGNETALSGRKGSVGEGRGRDEGRRS